MTRSGDRRTGSMATRTPSSSDADNEVTHVIIFPFPAQGHVTPSLQLAELLSLSGILITFLNTDQIHRRLTGSRRSSVYTSRLSSLPGFRFCTVSDGLPPKNRPQLASMIPALIDSLTIHAREEFRRLLLHLPNEDDKPRTDTWPKVTCVITDGLLPFALETAVEEGIPVILFRTSSPTSVLAYQSIPKLMEEGQLPIPEGGDLDEVVRGILLSGNKSPMIRRRDLPSFCRTHLSPLDPMLQLIKAFTKSMKRGRGLILNTFVGLDAAVFSDMLYAGLPKLYPIGPIHLLLESVVGRRTPGECLSGRSSGFWEEDHSCMAWLNSQPEKSVVYVSFGSVALVTAEQLKEFWFGLVNSGHRFLWALRPDVTSDVEEGGLRLSEPPEELKPAAKERGMVVGWAPQLDVLAHPAVGCFLTHSGWNSTVESIAAGVPMVCWPFFADQMINSRLVEEAWGVGLDMKDMCHRSIVEEKVRAAMEGEKSLQLRRLAMELAVKAKASVEPEGGSSYAAFQELLQVIKSFN